MLWCKKLSKQSDMSSTNIYNNSKIRTFFIFLFCCLYFTFTIHERMVKVREEIVVDKRYFRSVKTKEKILKARQQYLKL